MVRTEVNEKEIAPLVKWSLRLPYTFLSVGIPFIEEGGKMPSPK
jgi:phage terminase Nu1 subunit (DNA packaging protein)